MFELTLDQETTDWLRYFYKSDRHVVLEYGTGGSTVLALESNPNTIVYACETDSAWLGRLMLHLAEKKISDRVYPVHLDIGQTGAWGVPVFDEGLPMTSSRMQKFLQAHLIPWKLIRKHRLFMNCSLIIMMLQKSLKSISMFSPIGGNLFSSLAWVMLCS